MISNSSSSPFPVDIVFDSPKFKQWRNKIEKSGTIVETLEVLGVISRDQRTLFGAFIDCIMITPEGERLPRCMFIRGESVVVVPVLNCMDNGETYTLLVEQRRPVDGEMSLEFPGGMLDHHIDKPVLVAIQEIQEELGLEVSVDELILLNQTPIKACSSTVDEVAHFYYFKKQVSQHFLEDLENRKTGLHEDGEHLCIRVTKMCDVWQNPNFSAIVGIKLLERALKKQF